MKEKHTVKVNIFGSEYPIKSEADPEYVKRVAKYVDRKMREISDKIDIRSTSKVAILAALNITDELFQEKSDKDKTFAEVEDRTAELAEWLEVGEMTLADMLHELVKPGRDPRDDLDAPILRSDVLSMEDLRPGMQLKGVVRNVVDFGAFVDIGVKQDGLVHVSQMSDRRVRDPYSIISVGDVVEVKVLNVDLERGRIGLSLRLNP